MQSRPRNSNGARARLVRTTPRLWGGSCHTIGVKSVKTGARVGVLKSISAFETNQSPAKRKAYPPKLGVGFLLVDSSLSSISFNAEAIHILGYPDKVENLARSESLLSEEIRSRLRLERSLDDSAFITEFQSGRRRYFCRAFQIGSHRARFCSIQHSASA